MTDHTAERQLLRDVLTWARANGWRRVEPYPSSWPEWTNFQQDSGPNVCLYKPEFGEDYDEIRAYFFGPDVRHVSWRPTSIREAVDVLAALGVLPVAFSTAYSVGHEDGGNEISADAVERGVEVQMDMLLDRLGEDDQRRTLGDLIERDPHGPALSTVPYMRRLELDAICDAVTEILGVDNAS